MGLGRELVDEYIRHRLYGGRHRRYGHYPMRRGPERFYGLLRPRRRRSFEVRGCGCCLPIPLGLVTAGGVGLRVLARRGS
jgi:hypothetical protein